MILEEQQAGDTSSGQVEAQPPGSAPGGLKRRAAAGVAALLLRRVAAQIITIIGTTLLMRLLTVEQFGVYAIVLFVVTLGGYFADAGLGAALVQRKAEITHRELSLVFTVQLTLLTLVLLVVVLIAPWLGQQYDLPSYAPALLGVLSLSLLISSFKTPPAILLERRLDYHKLSISDLAELITFQAVAVLLAVIGLGVWSFVIAAITQAVVGSLVLNLLCPWRLRLRFDLNEARSLLRFGALYQARTLINVVKDNITPTLIALTGGPLAVGYVGFAQRLSSYPLMIEAATSRVAFPAYSRIQEDLRRLRAALEKTLKVVNLILFPLTAVLMALAEPLTHFVFGDKWLPALPAFYLFSLANLTAGTSNVLVTSLYALGRPGVVLKLSIFWAVTTWLLAAPLVLWLGWIGLPVAIALLSVTVVLPIYEVRKIVAVDVIQSLYKPGLAALMAAFVAIGLGFILNSTLLGVALNAVLSMMTYAICLIAIDRRWLASELATTLPAEVSDRLIKLPLLGVLAPTPATTPSDYLDTSRK